MLLSESYKNRIMALATGNPSELHNKLLSEGRYDKVSGEIVDLIWGFIRDSKNNDDGPDEVSGYKYDFTSKEIDVLLTVYIKREEGISYQLSVDAGQSGDEIDFLIHLNPAYEPQSYVKLNSKLQDAVRHEIEHILQGPNNISFKEKKAQPTSMAHREKIQTPGNTHKYFTLRDEIPAMVNGMYRQAKTEKRSLVDIFKEYIGYYLEQGEITQKQYDKILNVWINYAKKNLPKAQLD